MKAGTTVSSDGEAEIQLRQYVGIELILLVDTSPKVVQGRLNSSLNLELLLKFCEDAISFNRWRLAGTKLNS